MYKTEKLYVIYEDDSGHRHLIPKEYYKDVNHIFIWHGRNLCTSQNPKCDKCPLKNYCKFH